MGGLFAGGMGLISVPFGLYFSWKAFRRVGLLRLLWSWMWLFISEVSFFFLLLFIFKILNDTGHKDAALQLFLGITGIVEIFIVDFMIQVWIGTWDPWMFPKLWKKNHAGEEKGSFLIRTMHGHIEMFRDFRLWLKNRHNNGS